MRCFLQRPWTCRNIVIVLHEQSTSNDSLPPALPHQTVLSRELCYHASTLEWHDTAICADGSQDDDLKVARRRSRERSIHTWLATKNHGLDVYHGLHS